MQVFEGVSRLATSTIFAPRGGPITARQETAALRRSLVRSSGRGLPTPPPAPGSPAASAESARGHTRNGVSRAPRYALLMRKTRRQGNVAAMSNPYGIALNRAWTEWATECAVSETTAAALYLLSENRRADEVAGQA